MNRFQLNFLGLMLMLLTTNAGITTAADVPPPPVAPKGDVVDTYFGHKVPDPYRWLEDVHSDQTLNYARAQHARFEGFVAGTERDAIRNA